MLLTLQINQVVTYVIVEAAYLPPSTFTDHGHLFGVTSKPFYIPFDPLKRGALIPKAIISLPTGFRSQKSKNA